MAKLEMKSKSTIFWLGIIFAVAGFVVGTLGDLSLISTGITPATRAASQDFVNLENGKPITNDSRGFPLLVQATEHYCDTHNIEVPWSDFRIVRFENRRSFAPMPVFFAVSHKNQLLQLRFDWFAIELHDVIAKPRIILAIGIFILGLALTILDRLLKDNKVGRFRNVS